MHLFAVGLACLTAPRQRLASELQSAAHAPRRRSSSSGTMAAAPSATAGRPQRARRPAYRYRALELNAAAAASQRGAAMQPERTQLSTELTGCGNPKHRDLCACMMALIARLILRSQHLTLFSPVFHLASRGLPPSVVPLACLADRLLNITLPPPPPCTTPYLQLFLLSLPLSSAASPLPPLFFPGHSCAGPCGSLADYKQV